MNKSDIIGWLGFIIVLFCYWQVATHRWRVRSIPNQIGNLVGSGALALNSFFYNAWVPFVLNVVWALIGIFCLLQLTKEKKNFTTPEREI